MKSMRKQMVSRMALLAGTAAALAAGAASAGAADLVVQNGAIVTSDGRVSAMAVEAGTIIALGSDDEISAHVEEDTRVVDLDGKTVLPGLFDNHIHAISAGLNQQQCQLPYGASLQQVRDIVGECAANAEAGDWIVGGPYETETLGQQPAKEILDELAPDNPVVLRDISYHSRWINSAALEAAGITAETEAPENGIIVRDDDGEPTGVLHETATGLVSNVIPAPTQEENLQALRWMQEEALSYGIIGWDAALVDRAGAETYAAFADAGELVVRVRACMREADEELIDTRAMYVRERFSPSCIKSIIDGVPTDSNTAAMLEPYHASADPGEPGTGELMKSQETLNELLTRYDAMGLTVKVHAAGDAAVRAVIDAIAAAREANGFTGLHHNVSHASFVAPEDFAAARAAGATIEFSPYIWFDNPIVQGITVAVGEERMQRWIPIADALEAGVEVVPGSDYSVVPSVNPWVAIETMVTRQKPGGGDREVGASQKISLERAVDLFTSESAQYRSLAHLTGSIDLGKYADFIVIDRDIFNIEPTEIHRTRVLSTFVEGEEVYTAEEG